MAAVRSQPGALEPGSTERVAEVRDLGHVYRTGDEIVVALRGIDFDLGATERLAIMGRSGSGKTTLLRVLAALEAPTRGDALVAGQDLVTMTPRQREAYRRRTVGYVWQEPEMGLLTGLTTLENVLVPTLDGGGSRQDASVGHADACAVRVTGVGAPSEPDDRVVVLVARAEEARQPRGPADDEREHTACAGVEGAGMADSRFTQHPSHGGRREVVPEFYKIEARRTEVLCYGGRVGLWIGEPVHVFVGRITNHQRHAPGQR